MFHTIIDMNETGLSTGISLVIIFITFLLGILISLTYMYTQKKGSYTKEYVVSLVILSITSAIVMILVGNNLARAAAIAGSLLFVRHRSAAGTAKEITFVFATMAVGASLGLGYIAFGILAAVLICLAMLFLHKISFGESSAQIRQLKITIPEDLNYKGVFDDLFTHYTLDVSLTLVRTVNMGTLYELTYQVTLKPEINEKDFIDQLRCRNGNLNISLGVVPDRNYYIQA